MSEATTSGSGTSRGLCLVAGVLLLASALLYNEFLFTALDSNPPLAAPTLAGIRGAQLSFLVTGLFLLTLWLGSKRAAGLDRLLARPLATNVLLGGFLIVLPGYLLETGLRPFAAIHEKNMTTVFAPDEALGWKHRPNTVDLMDGVTITINAKGLRGPEFDYARTAGAPRILFLGDSVPFGVKLTYDQTYPSLIGSLLSERLGRDVEAINAGVGGYSPWQEYVYLAEEGVSYRPDLVVVSFTLSDVTEKFGLTRFGGEGEGWQLGRSASNEMAELLKRIHNKSAVAYFIRRFRARVRYGPDMLEEGRVQEQLDVEHLAHNPERRDVLDAWELTLENLGQIVRFCEEREVAVVLAVFPQLFQFGDAEALTTPQRVLRDFATEYGIPMIDLLPALAEGSAGSRETLESYFLDDAHYSAEGSRVVAEALAEFLARDTDWASGRSGG